jgi:uncharacterized protein (TIGR02001 family)
MKKTTTLIPALVLATAAAVPATSMAEVTGNIGYVSEYVYRGVFQEESSAYAGADYTADSGFYLGTWWADVGIGTETDIYFGWSGGNDNVTYKIGYTGYLYLDDFDGDYSEVNLGLYAGIFALDVAIGTYDPLDAVFPGLDDQDYTFTSITLSPEVGPYYKYGMWSGDFEDNILFPNLKTFPGSGSGDYLEVGYTYSFEEQGIDLSAALIHSGDLVVAPGSDGDYTLTFGIKKTFSMN